MLSRQFAVPVITEGPRHGRLLRAVAVLGREDRFLSFRMLMSIAAYLLIAASYIQARISDDGVIYYDFMRRLAGEDVKAHAYQFGVVFWNLPFYLVSRIVTDARGTDVVGHLSVGVMSVAAASTAAILAIFYVSWLLLRDLELRGSPEAILLAVFGSPLFYYAIFQPGLKHAFDALLATVLALLLLRASLRPTDTRLAIAIGVVVASLITVRYANIALLAGILYVFLRRRAFIQAYATTATAIACAAAILLLPLALGVPYGLPPAQAAPVVEQTAVGGSGAKQGLDSRMLAGRIVAAPAPERPASTGGGVDDVSSFKFEFLAPLKMLFTLKRGLFVWTPLTLFGVVGYLMFLRRAREQRTFLIGLGLSALALLLIHMVWGAFWTGGYSFSQRFLTSMFPLFAIGISELLGRRRMLVAPLLVACVAWTGFLALHHFYGYDNVGPADGVGRIVGLYRTGEETPHSFWHERIVGPVSRHWDGYFDSLGDT